MPKIRSLLETSFIDWPGRMCAVVFLGGCNFRCPFCHNHALVLEPDNLPALSLDDILTRLARLKKWLGGICISGGEPTLLPGLIQFLSKIKDAGWAIKLDTNGSRPEVLAEILDHELVDMVSMDVKAPLNQGKYSLCAGTPIRLDVINKSIALLFESRATYEFRMTVVPGYHAEEDVLQWTADLAPFVDDHRARLKIQNFSPQTTLDPKLEFTTPFSPDVFSRWQDLAKRPFFLGDKNF